MAYLLLIIISAIVQLVICIGVIVLISLIFNSTISSSITTSIVISIFILAISGGVISSMMFFGSFAYGTTWMPPLLKLWSIIQLLIVVAIGIMVGIITGNIITSGEGTITSTSSSNTGLYIGIIVAASVIILMNLIAISIILFSSRKTLIVDPSTALSNTNLTPVYSSPSLRNNVWSS